MKNLAALTILLITCVVFTINAQESDLNKKAFNTAITAKYQLFPTQNMWTFLKLNTRTGEIWQVQFDIEEDNRFESYLNSISLVNEEEEVNGRFTLYPTQNVYNFILLDQIDGRTWQAQWSMEPENRGIIPIR